MPPFFFQKPQTPAERRRLERKCAQGLVSRVMAGVYAPLDLIPTEERVMQWVAQAQPAATMNLISALSFHGITTQIPDYLSVALPRGVHAPKVLCSPTRYWFVKPELMESGYVELQGEIGTYRVTTPERTLADCCKYRNKIGMDVFLEALRMASPRLNVGILMQEAEKLRVANIMTPYLKTILS